MFVIFFFLALARPGEAR